MQTHTPVLGVTANSVAQTVPSDAYGRTRRRTATDGETMTAGARCDALAAADGARRSRSASLLVGTPRRDGASGPAAQRGPPDADAPVLPRPLVGSEGGGGLQGSVSRRWGSRRRGWQLRAPPTHPASGISTGPPRATLGGVLPRGSVHAGRLRSPGPGILTGELLPAPRRPRRVSRGRVVAPSMALLGGAAFHGKSTRWWPRAPNLLCDGPRGAGPTDGPGQPPPVRGRVAKVVAPAAAVDKMTGAAEILPSRISGKQTRRETPTHQMQ